MKNFLETPLYAVKMCTCYFFWYGCVFCNKHNFYLLFMLQDVQWTLCFCYNQNNNHLLSYSTWTSGIQKHVTNIKKNHWWYMVRNQPKSWQYYVHVQTFTVTINITDVLNGDQSPLQNSLVTHILVSLTNKHPWVLAALRNFVSVFNSLVPELNTHSDLLKIQI